jgi:hypothetical protein
VPFGRRTPQVVKDVVLPERERRLAWALTGDGAAVVATGQSLVLPDGTVLPWAGIEKAVWRKPVLTVTESAEVEGAGPAHALDLVEGADLAAEVYTRVTASVAWQKHEKLSPGGGVRLVGRRQPTGDDLAWQLVFDPGTDLTDPLVREQAQQLLSAARRSIG